MDKEQQVELDMMMQDLASDLTGVNGMNRTEVNRKLHCLKDVAIIHVMVNDLLAETDELEPQLYIMDAVMKICWRLMEVNGFDGTMRARALSNMVKGTKFENHGADLLAFRTMQNNKAWQKKKEKEGEGNDGEH